MPNELAKALMCIPQTVYKKPGLSTGKQLQVRGMVIQNGIIIEELPGNGFELLFASHKMIDFSITVWSHRDVLVTLGKT